MAKNAEIVTAALIIALTAAIATNILEVPGEVYASPVSAVLFVLLALGAFAVYPAVGLALFLLTAVVFFKRNVTKTVPVLVKGNAQPAQQQQQAKPMKADAFLGGSRDMYGAESIPEQSSEYAKPYASLQSGPRNYDEFAETDGSNPMIGPIEEAFEPAPYGDESGAPVDGQYPKENPRPIVSPDVEEYRYEPDPETGSNEFKRYGPDLDVKSKAFYY